MSAASPPKALIHAADNFHQAVRLARKPRFGIAAGAPGLDFAATIDWKDAIVERLKGGVAGLLKRSNVKIVRGRGVLLDGKTVRVETHTGPQTIRADSR